MSYKMCLAWKVGIQIIWWGVRCLFFAEYFIKEFQINLIAQLKSFLMQNYNDKQWRTQGL